MKQEVRSRYLSLSVLSSVYTYRLYLFFSFAPQKSQQQHHQATLIGNSAKQRLCERRSPQSVALDSPTSEEGTVQPIHVPARPP